MLGRGLRTAPGKSDFLVLDHSGCVHKLGFATDERHWSLDGHADIATTKAARERAAGKDVTCPECQFVYTGSRQCAHCGHYIAPRGRMIQTVDGDLVEIGEHAEPEDKDRMAFFCELRGYAGERAYKPGWAAHKYREKHGAFPPYSWNQYPAATPTETTRRWVKSRQIAFAKSSNAVRKIGTAIAALDAERE